MRGPRVCAGVRGMRGAGGAALGARSPRGCTRPGILRRAGWAARDRESCFLPLPTPRLGGCGELESAQGSGCRKGREAVGGGEGWGLHVSWEGARGWGEGLHGDGRCLRGAGGWHGACKGWGLRGAGVGVALLPSPAAPGMPRLQ